MAFGSVPPEEEVKCSHSSPETVCLVTEKMDRASLDRHSMADTASASCSEDDFDTSTDEDEGDYDASPTAMTPGVLSTTAVPFNSEPTTLASTSWLEPDGTSFKVRTKAYLSNGRRKLPSPPSAFRLLAVDLVEATSPLTAGLCSHSKERVQRALARDDLPCPFIFAVNIMVPGPPFYHLVMYYGVEDVSMLQDTNTPFGRLANKFFFGDDDKFRDATFKLVPRVVGGNFMVKKAVGSKPAIMGKKLKQTYIRTERYFELILDVGSNPVATKIVKMSIGFAKTLVVDMAFILEGKDESTLPEQVMGCCRLKNVGFKKLRVVS